MPLLRAHAASLPSEDNFPKTHSNHPSTHNPTCFFLVPVADVLSQHALGVRQEDPVQAANPSQGARTPLLYIQTRISHVMGGIQHSRRFIHMQES